MAGIAPLPDLAAALRGGTRSLLAYVDETFDAVARTQSELLAALPEPGRRLRLLTEAQALLARWPDPATRPPLFGLLVGVKDVLNVDGLPTRAGSALPPDLLTGAESGIVRRLRAAGALIFGKTVTTEFAYAEPGPTANPRNPAHTPGGSSSGSAALVGAGLLPLALGTQTVGSVIRPAAYCGIVGFKPSYGRLPVDGLLHFSHSIDTLGLFTPEAAGMRMAAAALLDRWAPSADPAGQGARDPIRLLVPDGPFMAQADDDARARFEATLVRLEAAGVRVQRVPMFDDLPAIAAHHTALIQREFAEVHRDWFARFGALYRPVSAQAWRAGARVSDDDYAAALASTQRVRARMEQALAEQHCDAWVCPAAPGPAPAGLRHTGDPAMNMPFSHAGVPALTLPCDAVPAVGGALPLGLQLGGRHGADEALLALGERLEAMLARA